jgi:hypothetical protein
VETKLVEFEVDMGLGDSCVEHGSYYKINTPKEEPKDVVLGYKTSLDAQILDSQLPKTTSDKWKEYQDWLNEPPELSDEEIEKAIDAYFPKTDINARWGWKLGAEWYRKQLKTKL